MYNLNFLKYSACFFMLVDHIGAYLFPDILFLRIIGRFAFPLFAYLIYQGYFLTSDLNKYAKRLFILATLWQLPFTFFIYKGYFPTHEPINVIFTLLVGLYCIDLLYNKKFKHLFIVFALSIVCDFLNIGFQYGTYGIALILSCYFERFEDLGLYFLFILSSALTLLIVVLGVYPQYQLFAPFAFLLTSLPITLRLNLGRYFFYLFYPIHIIALLTLKNILC